MDPAIKSRDDKFNGETMAILEILQHPHPNLKLAGEEIKKVDASIKKIIDDLYETMYSFEHCVGLAATQVNIQKKVAVIDISEERNEPLCIINPVIIDTKDEVTEPESCMSVPAGISENVTRPETVTVEFMDAEGKKQKLTASGFLAKAIQHETDHLNGMLFIDHVSRLKRERIEKRMSKWRKRYADHAES